METATDKAPKEVRTARPIATRKLEFTVADFDDCDRAIKARTEVYLVNPKKQTSVRGFLIEWVDRDEARETVIFRWGFTRKYCKVRLGQIYLAKKATL